MWQHDKFKPHLPPSVRACMARFLYSNYCGSLKSDWSWMNSSGLKNFSLTIFHWPGNLVASRLMFTFYWQSCQPEQLLHLRLKPKMRAIFTIFTVCTVCRVATMWAIFTIWCHFWPTVPPSLVLPYFLLCGPIFPGTKPSLDLCWLELHNWFSDF